MASGEYQGTQNLELIKGNPSDKLYYTLDGSEPGITSTEYTAPIALQPGDITIKVIEVNEVGVKTPVQESKYAIKQNKLSNEEFLSKLKGIWYSTESEHADLGYIFYINDSAMTQEGYSLSNNKTDNMCNADGSSCGKFDVIDTTANGGTINVPHYAAECYYDLGSVKIEFDFGVPGDNKITYRFTDFVANPSSKVGGNVKTTDWIQLYAAEELGNNKYRIPPNHYRSLVN